MFEKLLLAVNIKQQMNNFTTISLKTWKTWQMFTENKNTGVPLKGNSFWISKARDVKNCV